MHHPILVVSQTCDHKPELLWCLSETQVSRRRWSFRNMKMQPAEHGSIPASGSVMVLELWASSEPDLQPCEEAQRWGWLPPSLSSTWAALFFIADRSRAWAAELSRRSDLTTQNQQRRQWLNQFNPIPIWSSELSVLITDCSGFYVSWT